MFRCMERSAEQLPRGGTRHAVRVAEVFLALLDAAEGSTVTDIAEDVGVSKSVVHRVVSALASRELVARTKQGRYGLGPAAQALGVQAFRNSRLISTCRPHLRRLQQESGETATMAARIGDHRIHLDQILSAHGLRMSVELGRSFPLHAGATGKVILAFAPREVRARILSGPLAAVTDATVTDPAILAAELERIRTDGAAATAGERQVSARSVAAPILDRRGESIGAITVCGPTARYEEADVDRARPLVVSAARTVSAALAAPGER